MLLFDSCLQTVIPVLTSSANARVVGQGENPSRFVSKFKRFHF
jgi:hypothetical protein